MRSAIFLDRDGTINIDESGYISKPEDIHLYPFAAEAIRIFNEMNYYVFIVTNQSGVARGKYTLEDAEKVNEQLIHDLEKAGAKIDDIFISPYHKDGIVEPYNIDHNTRKPNIGLFQAAQKEYDFSIKNSWMIGDKFSDIGFGRNSGLKIILVATGNGRNHFMNRRKHESHQPDFYCENLLIAANLIRANTSY